VARYKTFNLSSLYSIFIPEILGNGHFHRLSLMIQSLNVRFGMVVHAYNSSFSRGKKSFSWKSFGGKILVHSNSRQKLVTSPSQCWPVSVIPGGINRRFMV
jgi:hypothetical protein